MRPLEWSDPLGHGNREGNYDNCAAASVDQTATVASGSGAIVVSALSAALVKRGANSRTRYCLTSSNERSTPTSDEVVSLVVSGASPVLDVVY